MSKFNIRGIVEGFYGPYWSEAEREDIIEFVAGFGYNYYFYAPKHDLYHRKYWHKKYPLKPLKQLKSLIKSAKKSKLKFSYCISPGLSIRYGNKTDFWRLMGKLYSLSDAGCDGFSILLDDIPNELPEHSKNKYNSLAEAQADLINKAYDFLKKRYPSMELFFCPTEYCESFAGGDLSKSEYLKDIGLFFNPEINFFWTGDSVIPEKVTTASIKKINRVVRRKIVLWENYFANDYCNERIFLGPLEGRSKTLHKHVAGLVLNPCRQVGVTKIAASTVSDYMKNPEKYNPQKSWLKAMRNVAGKKGLEVLRSLGEFQYSPFNDGAGGRKIRRDLAREILAPVFKPDKIKKIVIARKKMTSKINPDILGEKMFVELHRFRASLNYTLRQIELITEIFKDNRNKNKKEVREKLKLLFKDIRLKNTPFNDIKIILLLKLAEQAGTDVVLAAAGIGRKKKTEK
jgi:hypothetical protein